MIHRERDFFCYSFLTTPLKGALKQILPARLEQRLKVVRDQRRTLRRIHPHETARILQTYLNPALEAKHIEYAKLLANREDVIFFNAIPKGWNYS